MKQKVVGVYFCGFDQCQLVLREGTGGEFFNCPEKGSISRIKIGADQNEWRDIVDCLLHEVEEFILDKLVLRYEPFNCMGKDHGSYIFVLRHDQFSDVMAKTADYITAALPDLEKVWKIWKNSK